MKRVFGIGKGPARLVSKSGMALGFFNLGPETHMSGQIGVPRILGGSKNLGELHVAKCNLGKVNLEPMQSAVVPICVRDLRGDPLQLAARLVVCRRFVSHFS